MIYQLKKVNIKRTTTRKVLCSTDNSGVINVFTMLQPGTAKRYENFFTADRVTARLILNAYSYHFFLS